MARDISCADPDNLLGLYPCLKCATVQELLVIIVGLLLVSNGNEGDIPAAEAEAAPLRSLPLKEKLQVLITSFPEAVITEVIENGATLKDAFACLKCYPTDTLLAMLINQWCHYNNDIQ